MLYLLNNLYYQVPIPDFVCIFSFHILCFKPRASWNLTSIVGILVTIKFLQHNANWTSCAAIMVAVLISHHSVMATKIALMGVMNLNFAIVKVILNWLCLNVCVMATETAKTSLMRTQKSVSARKMTSSVKGDIYLPDFNSNFNSIIQTYTRKSPRWT